MKVLIPNKYYIIDTEHKALIHKTEPLNRERDCVGFTRAMYLGVFSLTSEKTKHIFFDSFSSTYLMYNAKEFEGVIINNHNNSTHEYK